MNLFSALGDTKAVLLEEDDENKNRQQAASTVTGIQMSARNARASSSSVTGASNNEARRGMVLPFEPLSLAFNHVSYYVDMPAVSINAVINTTRKICLFNLSSSCSYQEMKTQGVEDERLQLLRDVSGAFRPSILTALVGVSGAGKTTLMDVLAGRKTGGYIEGSISISGYPKNQETFARVSGYCEQNDIHSPYVTVYESLLYSAWLRLAADVKTDTRKACSSTVS